VGEKRRAYRKERLRGGGGNPAPGKKGPKGGKGEVKGNRLGKKERGERRRLGVRGEGLFKT